MTVHEIKEWPATFGDLIEGKRKIEIRFNDRDYQKGDALKIRECDPMANAYTGRECARRVDTVHESPRLMPGYVVMEVSPMDAREGLEASTPGALTAPYAVAHGEGKRTVVCTDCGAELDANPNMRHLCTVPDDGALFSNEPRSNPAAAISGR